MGCAVTYFLDVGAYVASGAVTATSLKKGNKKMKIFCIVSLRQIRSSALNFFMYF